ncbi:uncharacterized protein LOC126734781 [Anthonomus grandis grandis]|uniref:uncharacterized protein LOC126734781 n=1 Tax=Anthonomus grandis grandis TaxID=2921223 RepID=UPI0021664720|nr:uncharacterized protein LOC126734781 [Anthonomus grandis grandis]
MDRSIDNYLHKKFKKQLSVEPKQQHHQQNDRNKENKEVAPRKLEPSEEKTSRGNTEPTTVPNESTNNHHASFMPIVGAPDHSKSSISCESGNFKPCISNSVESQQPEAISIAFNFDTNFRQLNSSSVSETTKIVNSPSSSVNEYPHYNQNQTSPPPPIKEDRTSKDDYNVSKPINEEVQPTPEKNSSGKYVCKYCNLVCSKPSVLQKHIRAHTNERPYPCNSCGFSFKTRSNLYKHCRSRTHANRIMGVKAQENSGEGDSKQNYADNATQTQTYSNTEEPLDPSRNKPYKPRFHTVQQFENLTLEEERGNREPNLSHHINELINKNNSIVNSNDPNLLKRRFSEALDNANNNEYLTQRLDRPDIVYSPSSSDEPLNLTNKNRKRCMSEIQEPVIQKSLIKELLLKNLNSDMQCGYCKMIFRTVTELELHKMRNCKGKPPDVKHARSSSVNVASILTKNKNAFDGIPAFQNAMFPLNSPGPFLGKTRLVDSDKSKSFSFDAVNLPVPSPNESSPNFVLSPIPFKEEKKPSVKMFGGEVKIHNSSGESKSYRIDNKDDNLNQQEFIDFDGKPSENRVTIKSSLQSGGTVLTNKTSKDETKMARDIIRIYENTPLSPNINMNNLGRPQFNYEPRLEANYLSTAVTTNSRLPVRESIVSIKEELQSPSQKYPNTIDFSHNVVKQCVPNLKHPGIQISGMYPQNTAYSDKGCEMSPPVLTSPRLISVAMTSKPMELDNHTRSPFQPIKKSVIQKLTSDPPTPTNIYNPMNLVVNGKVIRYVPGMPGPVENCVPYGSSIIAVPRASKEVASPVQSPVIRIPIPEHVSSPKPIVIQKPITPIVERISKSENIESKLIMSNSRIQSPIASPKISEQQKTPEKIKEFSPPNTMESPREPKKFARPNSLALKPTTASLKQHHGLTPTIFNQILISPDTPRVAKKYAQQLFNGNYFSYLGLKSSTRPVYCTLNKTQPFYVPHFKKMSMYSEWRQQDAKVDKLYVGAYDSRQRNQKYTTAGKTDADLIIHSSYKFVVSEVSSKSDEEDQKPGLIGGYECNEDSPYIRGRGRGKYVCEQCGIRCKKPSMLKKHIRTHSNERPYTCNHCNFSFKTKGNLTKHMKSKSHTKNYTATSSGSGSSTHLSVSHSSDSDTEDSGMDSSDESMTRQQEHEAAYGLLSLSQKTTAASPTELLSPGIINAASTNSSIEFMTTEQISYVSKSNYAKNKILDNFTYKLNKSIAETIPSNSANDEKVTGSESVTNFLGKTSTTRPLTYPYTSILVSPEKVASPVIKEPKEVPHDKFDHSSLEPKSIKQFHVIQKYAAFQKEREIPVKEYQDKSESVTNNVTYLPSPVPTLKVNDVVVQDHIAERKRKITVIDNNYKMKVHRNDEVMDLSIASNEKRENKVSRLTIDHQQFSYDQHRINEDMYVERAPAEYRTSPNPFIASEAPSVEEMNCRNLENSRNYSTVASPQQPPVLLLAPISQENQFNNYDADVHSNSSCGETRTVEFDNSAMETLADVATKQVKLDKNTLAKSVASEYLKLATQHENLEDVRESSNNFIPGKEVNDMMVKSEGNKSCHICLKSFNQPYQLTLHMNIHYLERPFRCDTCQVSFRTKGHLQKHERSASHYTKLSSSPAQSSSEPRPFKCSDCNIAFRIHGHLAKHLRSKMHIMKLECLAKIPFGLYAELERSNSLLTEINTSDGDQCLESLKTLAKKVFINDPGKLQTLISEADLGSNIDPDS